ncbi:MAG: ABC transporter substrate-binding protein [Defluviitaleaceae bacterium]|nr:ABC transporter substrate-binding protein [Defluviitaleaceae bacterium]
MKKTFIFILFCFLAACSQVSPETNQANQTNRSITIATLPVLDAFPIFLAYDRGFFEAEGVHVVIQQFPAAVERDIAFQTVPAIDGIVTDLVGLTIFYEGGIDMVATSASIGLASLIGGEGVYSLADLYGNSVMISANTAMDYILHSSLQAIGMEQDDIVSELVPSLPMRLELMLAGQANAATMAEPFATMALDQGLNYITSTRSLDINPFIFTFRRQVAEERREDIQAFYRGVAAAIEFLNTAPREEFIDMIIEVVGYPPHTRDTLILPVFYAPAPPEPRHVQHVLDFSIYRRLLTTPLTVEDVVSDILEDILE